MIGALDTILQRPKTVLTMMVVLVAAGVMAYLSIPKEANPDIDVPVYYVSIPQQGISPKDAERLLVKPMETQLRGLDGLKELTAIASLGHAGIVLEFEIGTDKNVVLADIRDKVDQAKASLPADADEPAVFETNFALQPTIIVTLSGKVPERTLFAHARRLKDEIESISTVREANLAGNRDEMLEVELDLLKMESYDITQPELISALNQNNQLVAAGFIDDGSSRFNIKIPGLVESGADVYNIKIKQNGEGVVRLGDVAQIKRTFKDASSFTRMNGDPAMSIEVVKRIGTNIVDNNKEVRRVVKAFTKDWPEAIQVNFMVDQSSFIFEVLGSLQSSIMTAIALVMIMVVGALGVRSGILVGLAIPTSFMVGFLILGAMGMTVNMMVMFGMVLTVGMLVDGAIVVTEYADRKMAEGMHYSEAYRRSARLMFWPVVSSTATTLAAFLPLLMWPGVPGEFMSYLPIMVIIVLTASLMTALVFLPASGVLLSFVSEWLGNNISWLLGLAGAITVGTLAWYGNLAAQAMPQRVVATGLMALATGAVIFWIARIAHRWRQNRPTPENDTAKMLSSGQVLDVKRIPGPTGTYLRILKPLTGNILGNVVVIAAAVGITILTFGYFGTHSKGVEFFVDEEPDIAIVLISARGNLSAEQTRDAAILVEQKVLEIPGIDNVVMTATASGGGSGGGAINVNAPQDVPADVIATMMVELKDYSERRKAAEIFKDIEVHTANIPGVKVEVRKVEGGPPTGKDVRLQITSTDYDTMVAMVAKARKFFDGLDDLVDLEDGRPLPGIEWELVVDREEAGRYNTGITSVGAMVQLVTNGVMMGSYRPDDSEDELDIRARLPKEQRSLEQFEKLRVRTPNGQVPLSNFMDIRPAKKVASITRRDGLYAMSVKANLSESAKKEKNITPGDKVKEIQAWIDQQKWPENVFLKFRGADEEEKESGEFLAKAAVGALFLMFIILLTQFNSFYQAIITLLTVILAIVGVLIGMLITGQKFSIIMTGTGIVALAGIVVNNAIVLIDTYNRLRSEGVPVRDAVLKTSAQRLRPIMLTTITTILGLIPMALTINVNFIDRIVTYGGITAIWWVQLSTAVISGLAFSTVLTLVLIPALLALPSNIGALGQIKLGNPFRRSSSLVPATINGAEMADPQSQVISQESSQDSLISLTGENIDGPALENEVFEPQIPIDAANENSKPQTEDLIDEKIEGSTDEPKSKADKNRDGGNSAKKDKKVKAERPGNDDFPQAAE